MRIHKNRNCISLEYKQIIGVNYHYWLGESYRLAINTWTNRLGGINNIKEKLDI